MDDKGRRIAYKLRGTAHAEMVSHEFVTGPRVIVGPDDVFHCDDVQVTRFSDGTVVVANFASLPYRWRGRTIQPMDFLITNEKLSLKVKCPRKIVAGGSLPVGIRLENVSAKAIPPSAASLLGRGVAYSEVPLFEANVPPLGPGEVFEITPQVKAPREKGRMWIVANVAVPGGDPREVAEIAQCEVG
jgi:hypothetical protein